MEPVLTEFDLYLLAEGKHNRSYEKLGAHFAEKDNEKGVHFAVWAPNAGEVSIIGEFNGWRPAANPMRPTNAGIWEGFVPGIGQGALYKYHIVSRDGRYRVDKADPYGFASQIRPETASRVSIS